MQLGGVLLGLLNIAITIAILVFVGAIIVWVAKLLGFPIDWNVQRIYLLIVALIAVYMLVALLFGLPTWRIIHGVDVGDIEGVVRSAWLLARPLPA